MKKIFLVILALLILLPSSVMANEEHLKSKYVKPVAKLKENIIKIFLTKVQMSY